MVEGRSLGAGHSKSGEPVYDRPTNSYAPSPDWEKAYHRYRPLLFAALSKLARSGFAVPPDEGLDLIHDFFIEGWSPVQTNYDSSKSKYVTYLYKSFINFARPRIVRSVRWREGLLPPEQLWERVEASVAFSSLDDPERLPDLAAVRDALQRLPRSERELLLHYLRGNETSERKLADRFSLTRYALRLRLSDALAKVAVSIGERGSMTDPEWSFALALWRDKRTIREAARMLNRSVGEIQEMRAHLFRNLSNAIQARSAQEVKMSAGSYTHARVLLEAALSPDPGTKVFAALREHAELVLDYLGQPEAEVLIQKHEAALTAERLADIYAALGSDEAWSKDNIEIDDAFLKASVEEERSVGEAFYRVLIPALPYHLTDFSGRVFFGAPTVESEITEILVAEPSVEQGGPPAHDLARFGITPVTILTASQGVADLARRFCAMEEIGRGQKLILDRGGSRAGKAELPVLSRDLSVQEVLLVTELSETSSTRLFDWLTNVAGYLPKLFDGFEAQLWGDELRILKTDKSVSDLFERWFPSPKSREVAITSFTPEHTRAARQLLEESVRRDPQSADSWSELATILAVDYLNDWNGARDDQQAATDTLRCAEEALQEALRADPSFPRAHFADGLIRRAKGDHQGALDAFDRAIQLDPNFARAYSQKANQLILLGQPQQAPPLVLKAIALSPRDPAIGGFYWVIGRAYFLITDYENAIVWLRRAVEVIPNLWFSRAYLLSAYALTGRQDETRAALSEFKGQFSKYANLSRIREVYNEGAYNTAYRTSLEPLYRGLQLAGVQ
jgi:tetratricopeptide (TPR) repeat protein